MKTYQDFQKAVEIGQMIPFIRQAINEHRSSEMFRIALDADEYEAQRNVTIMRFTKMLYNLQGAKVQDFTSANNRLCNNYFHRLNTQRRTYSLGNGIFFTKGVKKMMVDGVEQDIDTTKNIVGSDFDTAMDEAAYFALIHGVSFPFWNYDHLNVFKLTEFVPLWDEETGALKAGIRFWSLDWNHKPVTVVLYEEDGYTRFKTAENASGLELVVDEEKQSYMKTYAGNAVDGEQIVGANNYSALPIVPLWGSKHHQSTLIGMRGKLDSYDLVASGFANDLQDCAEIYWIVENALGENDESLARFRDRMKLNHIALIDGDNSKVTPYTQEIPTSARTAFLTEIRNQIYEDFGGLDVHTVAAGATNDHIDAAYQPMDEEADDFEYQIIQCVRQILKLINVDDVPIFKRNRISNQKEQTEMVMMVADRLDDKTVLSKLPFISVDEIPKIMLNRDIESAGRLELEPEEEPEEKE